MPTLEEIVKQGVGETGANPFTTEQIADTYKQSFGKDISQADLQTATQLRSQYRKTPEAKPVGMLDSNAGISQINKQNDYLNQTYPNTPTLTTPEKAVEAPTSEPTKEGKAYFTNTAGQEIQFTQEQLNNPNNQSFLKNNGYVMAKSDFAVGDDYSTSKLQKTVDEKTAQIEGLTQDFLSYNVDKDPDFQGQAQVIKANFDKLRREMEKTNYQRQRAYETLGFRQGTTQYADAMSSGIVGEEITQGNERLSQITQDEAEAISAARTAFKTGKYTEFNEKVGALKDLREMKAQELANYNKSIADYTNRIREDRKMAMDEERFAMDLDKYKTEKMQKSADALGASLVNLDENFEVSEASMEQVAEVAREYGIDPNLVYSAMQKQAGELRKESREERGSFFERQKFAVEQGQNEFKNFMDEQKFALENEIFGLSREEFELKKREFEQKASEVSANQEIVKIGGVEYLRDKSTGELTLPKVPVDPAQATIITQKADDKLKLIDNILGSKGLAGSVGAYALGRWTPFTPDKGARMEFAANVNRLVDQETLDTLLQLKAQGGSLGAVSEKELAILQNAATNFKTWEIKDDNGNPTGRYQVSEKVFKDELTRIKDSTQRVKDAITKETKFQPFTTFKDLYQRGTPEQKSLYTKYNSDPNFKNASVDDIIEAVNMELGFEGEKGGGLFDFAVEKKFPAGKKGGQCGTFAHKIVDFPPIGDSKKQKFAAVDKIGIKKKDWDPQIGDVIITGEHPRYGHVAIVSDILPNGELQLTESNFKSDERITHSRTLNPRSSVIYGAIRGKYKV